MDSWSYDDDNISVVVIHCLLKISAKTLERLLITTKGSFFMLTFKCLKCAYETVVDDEHPYHGCANPQGCRRRHIPTDLSKRDWFDDFLDMKQLRTKRKPVDSDGPL